MGWLASHDDLPLYIQYFPKIDDPRYYTELAISFNQE